MADEGTQGTAGATDTGPGAGQQATAAAGVAGAGAAQGGQDDGFVRVPKAEYEAVKANDGRLRQLQQAGHLDTLKAFTSKGIDLGELRQTVEHLYGDMTDKEFNAFLKEIRSPAQTGQQQTGGNRAAGQQTDGQGKPLTEERLMAILKQEREDAANQTKTTQEQAAIQQAEQAAATFQADVAKELKIKDGAQSRSFKGIWNDAVIRVMVEGLRKVDPLLSADDAAKEAQEYVPTKEVLAQAKALAVADWKDLGNLITSDAADGQAGMPAGSLGAGPGSAQTAGGQKRTRESAMDAIISATKQRLGSAS